MRNLIGSLVVLALLPRLAALASAASLTITPSDSLAAAVAQLRPGDTLTLAGGTYTQPLRSGDVTFPSGTSWDKPITITGAPGATVTLTQDVNIQANSDGSSVRYLILQNLHTQTFRVGDASTGIRLTGSDVTGGVVITKTTEDVQLVGNTVHDAGVTQNAAYAVTTATYGCYCNGQHMVIDGNTFRHNAGYALHLYLSGGTVDNAVVRGNTFTGNAYDDGGRNLTLGVVILAGSNNLLCGNTFSDNRTLHGGPAVSAINGTGNVITGNTITGTNGPAIELNESASNTVVMGNSLANNKGDIVGPGMGSLRQAGSMPDCAAAPVAAPRPRPTHLRLRTRTP